MGIASGVSTVFEFEGFELDEVGFELRRDGVPVPVQPKAQRLLLYLVRNRDRLVAREELLESLWDDGSGTPAVLARAVRGARRAVGDTQSAQRFIRTVRNRGHRFVAPVSERNVASAVESRPDPFVGRDGIFEVLAGAIASASVGSGALYLLSGEPGIGKTRVVSELAQLARGAGFGVASGSCPESEEAPPLWVWEQVSRSVLEQASEDRRAELMAGCSAALLRALPSLEGFAAGSDRLDLVPRDPRGERLRLFEDLGELLRRSAARRPLLIVLDDLHRADLISLEFARFAAARLRDAAVVIVGTFRDTAVAGFEEVSCLRELASSEPGRRLYLEGLLAADVAELVQLRLGREPTASWVEAAIERTGGNPFFLNALLLGVERELSSSEERTALGDLSLLGGVRGTVGNHLSGVSERTREVLRAASLFGGDFAVPALANVMDARAQDMVMPLAEAERAGVLRRDRDISNRFRFAHALLRDGLRGELGAAERTRLHGRVGEALETCYGESARLYAAELAHHYFEGASDGRAEKALLYTRHAAAESLERLAYHDAAAHYERALSLVWGGAGDGTDAFDLLLRLADACVKAGRIESAWAACGAAARIARSRGEPLGFARAVLAGVAAVNESGPIAEQAMKAVETALAGLGESGGVEHVLLLAHQARLLELVGDVERSERVATEAAAAAERLGRPAVFAYALGVQYRLLNLPQQAEDRLEVATRSVRFASLASDERFVAWSHRLRLNALAILGRRTELDAELSKLGRLAEQLQIRELMGWVQSWRATRSLMEGRTEESERLLLEGIEMLASLESPHGHQRLSVQVAAIRREQHRVAELEPDLRDMVERHPDKLVYRGHLAQMLWESGRAGEARQEFERVMASDLGRTPRSQSWLPSVVSVVEICARMADGDRAGTLYELIRPYAGLHVVLATFSAYSGPVEYHLGRLSEARGDFARAMTHHERAISEADGMGAYLWTSRARVAMARAALAAGSSGCVDGLLELAGQAAREMRNPQLEREVMALRRRV